MPLTSTQDILNHFESVIDDTLDQVTELNLANLAKDEIEDERNWEYLKKVDTTKTVAAGDTYLTMKSLPTDFRAPLDSGIFVGTGDIIPYTQIPFEDRYMVQDTLTHRYYIDLANSQYAVLGKPQSNTIYFWYLKTSGTLDVVSVNPLFPSRFWALIAYKMAIMWFAIDQGDKSRSYALEWSVFYEKMHNAMVLWNERIMRASYQNRMESKLDSKYLPNVMST